MAYSKFSGEVPRILILRSQYWLDGACEAAATTLGWECASVPTLMVGAQTREQTATLLDAIVHTRPDFILSINLAGMDVDGMWARFFDDLGVPHVTWFVDNPRTIIMDRKTYASPHSVALTWDESYAPFLRESGFPHVHWLPLAAESSCFNAEPMDSPEHSTTFTGNSMVAFATGARGTILADPRLAHWADKDFVRDHVSREKLGQGLHAIIGADALEPLNPEQRRHLEMFFFLDCTRQLRHDAIAALQDQQVTVRGDDGWRAITDRAGPPLNYLEQLPAFYRNCAINLNFTSAQMPSAANQRVFDCPAAGGFLLTDAQTDLTRLFAKDEYASFTSIGDCAEKIRHYRANPAERIEIARKARRRILKEHTYVDRLKTIAQWVMDAFT
ncbi:MAG: glycosyltransferase [Candidatus Hydrogenedentes bacterium]|nr:glycosyltransferase [Candidatus Hydrogenedentota bacterium]